MISKLFCVAVACALLATARATSAEDFKAGDIVIYTRGRERRRRERKLARAILSLKTMDRCLIASSVARWRLQRAFELHDVVLEGGIMRMRELTGVELLPGSSIEAKPGGRHIMFVGLLHPLAAEEKVRGALQFEHAGRIEVEFEVIGMGAPPPGGRGD